MDILHLHYFIEVARQKSFTKASHVLHVSQPSISKVVKTLENELGAPLFERLGREVLLTDVGRAVFEQAQKVVNDFHDLTNEMQDVVHLKRGNLTIGLPPMVGARFFPQIIGKFKKLHPQIALRLIEVGSKQVELDVKSGVIDLGAVALPLTESGIESYTFLREPLQLLLPREHPLAEKAPVPISDLAAEDFILYRDDFSLNDLIYAECAKNHFLPNVVCQSAQWDFIAELVAARLGVALLPATICRGLDPQRFIHVPLESMPIPWHLAMIWKKDKYLSFAAREWIRLAKEHFAPPPSPN